MKLRKLNRAVHRDFGYFFFGMCIIYGLSGIALNHRHEWNPNYIITEKEYKVELRKPVPDEPKEIAMIVLEDIGLKDQYRTHLLRNGKYRIFIRNGSVNYDVDTGIAFLEKTRRRPIFYEVNFLHYNTPRKLWTWFSDIYAGSLIILAFTGLFVLKGKNGITGRGAWLTSAGIIIPLAFLFMYLNS